MNIRFEYLYRDGGNFKNWGGVVFFNPHHVSADVVMSMAKNVLIDQAYFVANKACVPDLHFGEYDEQLDHGWHEAHAFQTTDDAANDPQSRNIEEFMESLRFASKI